MILAVWDLCLVSLKRFLLSSTASIFFKGLSLKSRNIEAGRLRINCAELIKVNETCLYCLIARHMFCFLYFFLIVSSTLQRIAHPAISLICIVIVVYR